jgi:hypothetical protein
MRCAFQFIRILAGAPLVLVGAPIFTIGLVICPRDFARGFLSGWVQSNQLDPETKQ